MLFRKWLLYILALFPCLCFAAANINVVPAYLNMKAGQTKMSFKVYNKGAEDVTFRVRSVSWQQEQGIDSYTDTSDIIFNPPVMTIKPGDYQLVRLGFRSPLPPMTEHSYRVFLKQQRSIQAEETDEEKLVAKIESLLEFRLPLFVAPKKEEKDLQIQITTASDGQMQMNFKNMSNKHVLVKEANIFSELSLAESKDKGIEPLFAKAIPVYLLANQEKSIPLAWKKPTNMKEVVVKLKTDWGNLIEVYKEPS